MQRLCQLGNFDELNLKPMKNLLRLCSVGLLSLLISQQVFTQTVVPYIPVTNGIVNTIKHNAGKVYISGWFTLVGPFIPYGACVDVSTGAANRTFGELNGDVNVAVPDGSGGWYIGGAFTKIGLQTRNRLARINADGSLNAWNPNVNGTVTSILVNGSTVYVGGAFSSAGSQPRGCLAAINVSNGLATSWNPSVLSNRV